MQNHNRSVLKPVFYFYVLVFLLTACQPGAVTPQELPTLAVLPSSTPSDTPLPPPTDTDTPTATATATDRPLPSRTPFPSDTPRPTITPSRTVEPTGAAAGTATQGVLEQPTFATFTPAPPGTLPPPGTPQQVADVIITEQQFQEEVNQQISAYPTLQRAVVDFAPDGIHTQLTALGGQAFITGDVLLSILVSNGVAAISPTQITVNAPEPPEAYVEAVNGDFFIMMVNVLDTILKQRLGLQQDLENIVMTESTMEVTLLVPK